MSWPAGTIVVCVDDSWHDPEIGIDPVKGSYYTIDKCVDHRSRVFVALVEIPHKTPDNRRLYLSDHFRLAESSHSEAGSVRESKPVAR